MAIVADDLLLSIKRDTFHRLMSDAFLAPVPIFMRDEHDLDERIDNALRGLKTRKNADGSASEEGRTGACIAIQAVDVAEVERENTPTPGMGCRVLLEVMEHVNKNAATNTGTGINAAELVARVVQCLHGCHMDRRYTGMKLAPNNPVIDMNLPTGQRGYIVTFEISDVFFCHYDDAPFVTIAVAAGEVTLTASGADSIYYTTDGSYPGPGNPEATLYSAAFSEPTSPYTIRAAAQRSGYNDTKAVALTIG